MVGSQSAVRKVTRKLKQTLIILIDSARNGKQNKRLGKIWWLTLETCLNCYAFSSGLPE